LTVVKIDLTTRDRPKKASSVDFISTRVAFRAEERRSNGRNEKVDRATTEVVADQTRHGSRSKLFRDALGINGRSDREEWTLRFSKLSLSRDLVAGQACELARSS
jgi:hypothetical protein